MTAAILTMSGNEAYDLIFPEHFAMLPVTDQATMQHAMQNSTVVWIGYDGPLILCTWGLIPPTLLSDRAYLWLWTTEHLHEHVFMFVRHSQREIARMLERYSSIVGHAKVDPTGVKSIRWLRWLGATFGEPDGSLIPFEIRRKHG